MRKIGMAICLFSLMSLTGRTDLIFSRPARKSVFPRWPENTVLSSPDTSGETWRQTGVLQTAYRNARAGIKKTFALQGCVLEKHVLLSVKPGHRSELILWRRKKDNILVMISEAAADRTDLAWGIISPEKRKEPLKNQLSHLNQTINQR